MSQIEAAKLAVRVFEHTGKYRFLATLQGANAAPRRVALEIPFTVDRSEAESIASDEVTLIVAHKCCSHPWEVTKKEELKAKEQMAKNLEVLAEDKRPDRYEYKVTYFGNTSLSRREVHPVAPPDGWRLFSVTVIECSSDEKLLYTWERKVQ